MHFAGFALLILAATPVRLIPPPPPSFVHRVPQIQTSTPALFAVPNRHEAANEPLLFTCPKDGAQLRVPIEQKDKTYTCPVDGTTMQASTPKKKFLMLERP